ncbi:MAG: hypothetical protein AB8E15_12460 [Bdellovibrionales bacterium]
MAIKHLYKMLPKSMKHRLIRKKIKVPDFSNFDYEVKIAETESEIRQAFELIYNQYRKYNYASKNDFKMRITPYHMIPNTIILIVKHKVFNKVVGTCSLIQRSSMGLPLEAVFDLSSLVQEKDKVVEISSLAIDPSFNKHSGSITLPLIKFLTHITLFHLRVSKLLCVVHPFWADLYQAVYGFKKVPGAITEKYDFANGNPGVCLYGSTVNVQTHIKKLFKNQKQDFYKFMFSKPESFMHMPKMKYYDQSYFSFSEESFVNIFKNKEVLFEDLSPEKQIKIQNYFVDHKKYYSNLPLRVFATPRSLSRYDFIFNGFAQSENWNNLSTNITTKTISTGGIGFFSERPMNVGEVCDIKLRLASDIVANVKVRVLGSQGNQTYGSELISSCKEWDRFIDHVQNSFLATAAEGPNVPSKNAVGTT